MLQLDGGIYEKYSQQKFHLLICRAVRLTGPFVTMIYSMITGDMFTFGIIYLITVLGFSQAFFFLYKGHPQVESTLFATYPSTWMALFQTTLGDYNVILRLFVSSDDSMIFNACSRVLDFILLIFAEELLSILTNASPHLTFSLP